MKYLVVLIMLIGLSNSIYAAENIFKKLEKSRKYYDLRHQTLSNNISKSKIPKARAKDLEFDFTKLASSRKINIATTNKSHIALQRNDTKVKSIFTKGEKNINGNDINLKDQTEKLTANAEDIKINNEIYKEMWKIVKLSLGS